MKLYRLCLVSVIGLSCLLLGGPAVAKVVAGDVPSIEVSTVQGEPVNLSSLRGKVVLVDFWATWCGPCVKSFSFYTELVEKYGERGFVVLAVSVDKNHAKVRAFLDKHAVPFLVTVDDRMTLAKRFEPPAMPTAYLLDRMGKVRSVHPGFNAKKRDAFEAEVRALLAEPAPMSEPASEPQP